jgi:hypothetical protein
MATKLGIYNEALRLLRERRLASLSEERGPRREFDAAYDDAVAGCLESGFWNFAMRTVEVTASLAMAPAFGFTNVFEKPSDWVCTFGVFCDGRCEFPLISYNDETDYWYADIDPIYVRYVSNGADYGLDLTRWSKAFEDFVAASLAQRTGPNITQSETIMDRVDKAFEKRKRHAQARDAMNDAPGKPPVGTWVTSRSAGFSGRSRWNGNFR